LPLHIDAFFSNFYRVEPITARLSCISQIAHKDYTKIF